MIATLSDTLAFLICEIDASQLHRGPRGSPFIVAQPSDKLHHRKSFERTEDVTERARWPGARDIMRPLPDLRARLREVPVRRCSDDDESTSSSPRVAGRMSSSSSARPESLYLCHRDTYYEHFSSIRVREALSTTSIEHAIIPFGLRPGQIFREQARPSSRCSSPGQWSWSCLNK